MRGVTGPVCRGAASDRGGSPDRVESSARCEPGAEHWRRNAGGPAMTATRESLQGIGNILPIALSLLIAACGGGGGGSGGGGGGAAPATGGEWRGVVTSKGTLRSGLYFYQEEK